MRAVLPAVAAAAPVFAEPTALEVAGADGAVLARLAGTEWCLHWRHSVTGGAVADCFGIDSGQLILTRSYLHDYAAGLGHLPGRGVQRTAAGGGYWIDNINEAVPGNTLVLRVGSTGVGHRLVTYSQVFDLSAQAAGQRVTLRPLGNIEPPDS